MGYLTHGAAWACCRAVSPAAELRPLSFAESLCVSLLTVAEIAAERPLLRLLLQPARSLRPNLHHHPEIAIVLSYSGENSLAWASQFFSYRGI